MTAPSLIHPTTFLLVQSVFSLLYGWMTFSLSRTYPPTIRGFRQQSAALVLFGLAQAIIAVRGPAAPAIMVVAPSVLTCLAGAFVAHGMSALNGKALRVEWLVLLVSGNLGLSTLGASGVSFPVSATGLAHLLAVAVGFIAVWATIRRPFGSNGIGEWMVAVGLSVLAGQTALRAGFALGGLTPVQITSPLGSAILLISSGVAMGAASLGAILMGNERLRAELTLIAIRDMLSGVLTRRAWFEHVEKHLVALAAPPGRRRSDIAVAREREAYGILMVDSDFFKKINDTHGHQAGDNAIRALGSLLNKATRSADLAGRYGGEEFIVFVSEASGGGVLALATRLLEAARLTGPGTTGCPAFTVSIGAALARADETLEQCIGRADAALYRAKQGGRDRIELAS